MSKFALWFSRQEWLMIGSGVVGAMLVMGMTSVYGAGISPDSITYIAAARNLAEGNGFSYYDGRTISVFPPLFPSLLAVCSLALGQDPSSFVHIVNALLFGATVAIAGKMARKILSSWWLWIGVLLVLASKPLIYVSTYAWSEPLFMILVLMFLVFLDSHITHKDFKSLVLASCCAALACLTRYIGVTLVGTGVLAILFLRKDGVRSKAIGGLFLGILSGLPLGLWALRNYLLTGTLFGQRAPSSYSLFQNIWLSFWSVGSWYVPGMFTERPWLWIGLLSAAIVSGGLGFGLRENLRKVRIMLAQQGVNVLFVTIYAGYLVGSAAVIAFDRIDSRLLSPVYVPLTLLLLALARQLAEAWMRHLHPRIVNVIFGACVAISLLNAVSDNLQHAVQCFSEGLGYNSKGWRESAVISYLRQGSLDGVYTIYSNAPEAIYWLTGRQARKSPSKTFYNSPTIATPLHQLRGTWPEEDGAYLVWFDRKIRTYLYTPEELQQVASLWKVVGLSDGAIYVVSRDRGALIGSTSGGD